MTVEKITLALHIASGIAALPTGLIAAFTKKGGRLHKRMGNIFTGSMVVCGLSSLVLGSWNLSPFLLGIGAFTLYMVIGGKICFAIKKSARLRTFWKGYVIGGLLISLSMLGLVAKFLWEGQWQMALIFGVFSGIQTSMTLMDLRANPGLHPQKKVNLHINKMGGTLIAAITAFLVVNIQFSPAWVIWLLPTLIGSILIARANNLNIKKSVKRS